MHAKIAREACKKVARQASTEISLLCLTQKMEMEYARPSYIAKRVCGNTCAAATRGPLTRQPRITIEGLPRLQKLGSCGPRVYYDAFEQTLALENAGAMLKPGGLLLTNDRLPVVPGGSMRLDGITEAPYDSPGVSARQAVGWYRKQ
jgi:hypothetical protein